ncbi:MAG: helix-turn-helix transcriptional regulator [Clostridia bacterium]|nr:helix-turn-helix transcriptional regulator [Clostridia bacterium]
MNLGNKIRELRRAGSLTQEQLAAALNISPQAVSKWEMRVSQT